MWSQADDLLAEQTTDNTAKNTGGATGPPPASSNNENSGNGSGTGEEKPKIADKIKGALHMGKKE